MKEKISILAVSVILGLVFVSMPAAANLSSCTATTSAPQCTVHCHDGNSFTVEVHNTAGLGVNGSVRCGGFALGCGPLPLTSCIAQGGYVLEDDDDGVCLLTQGTSATCTNAI